jgi:flavin-dependent dehydrogenase
MDHRPVDADVVVIGGGPAGSAAATACATRGLGVVLCEREPPGGDRPGETLHPGIEPLLGQLGIADRLASVVGARHTGIWIEWGGSRRFQAFGGDAGGPWRGFQVWRADFDRLLLLRARETGAAVRQPCAVTGVQMRDGEPHIVTTEGGPIATRMVIDATGMTRFLARALGLVSSARSPRLIARYGYARGECRLRDEAPALVGDASGWTWTAMVRPRTYQWTRVSFAARIASDWVPEELRGLPHLTRARGADVTWRLATQVAGAGWFSVGDAAATLDPTSSRGVLKAIMSGMMAAHLVAAVLTDKAPADEAASAYHDWLTGWFSTDAAHMVRFYRDLGVVAFE